MSQVPVCVYSNILPKRKGFFNSFTPKCIGDRENEKRLNRDLEDVQNRGLSQLAADLSEKIHAAHNAEESDLPQAPRRKEEQKLLPRKGDQVRLTVGNETRTGLVVKVTKKPVHVRTRIGQLVPYQRAPHNHVTVIQHAGGTAARRTTGPTGH